MKVVLSGGGTSGHVNPALAVAEVLAKRGAEILYVGTELGPERRLVDRAGIQFEAIDIVGRERGLSRKNLVAVVKLVSATWRSAKILAAADPWVVLGTGGYVSLPVVVAAWMHRIPVVVHEQNSVLGLSNRVAARFAQSVAVSFPETMSEASTKVVLTGNPVRRQIVEVDRKALRSRALEALQLEPGRSTLLITGGSQGSASINGAAFEAYDDWRNEERMQVVHLVGPANIEAARVTLAERSRYSDKLIYRVFSYLDQMELAYAAADLAVCRSGATTVAELAVTGVPAILAPYPYSLDQDQLRNAEAMARAGAAEILSDSDISGASLSARVRALLFDESALEAMTRGMRSRAIPDADQRLAELVDAAAVGHSPPLETPELGTFAEVAPPAKLSGFDDGWRRIHLVGIGGAGMSALARILIEAGLSVSGSDRSESSAAESLRRLGATVWVGHSSGRMQGVDAVLASSAIPSENVELTEARNMGITILSRGEAIARIVQGRRTIAISGTHGKTTTSAMTASILQVAGRDPLYIVGGPFAGGSGGHLGSGEWAVVEADEAFGSFLLLEPEIGVVTNVDEDHLDYYGGLEGLQSAFKQFASRAQRMVVCLDDPGASEIAEGIFDVGESRQGFTYGLSATADVGASEVDWDAAAGRFQLVVRGSDAGRVRLPVGGEHNVLNALGAAACSLAAGIGIPEIIEGLESFPGVGRRFESRGHLNGAELRDDYAHNPGKLAAALSQARAGQWSRIIAVFQPHLYSRTRVLWRELGKALTAADVIVITDIDGAREEPVAGISGKMVVDAACEAAPGKRVIYLPTLDEAAEFVGREARDGDLVLTLGCGYVNKLHDLLERDDAA